ncbi:MAG: hypothetical protein GY830_11425 [Bacteroidetes bacterium]|nr:hypothetical protein [Bacteroidota bacterium]
MKYIKKIAFGTMTSALCLSGFASNADRMDLSVAGGVNLLIDGSEVFGKPEKKASTEETTTTPKADDDKESLGMGDTWSFAARGEFGYVYDINEYFGVGVVLGVGYYQNGASDVQGSKSDDGKTEKEKQKGNSSAKFLNGFGGLRLMVKPSGEDDWLLGMDIVGKYAFMGWFTGPHAGYKKETGEGAAKEHRTKEAIQEETSKAMNNFGFGVNLFAGYDFRNVMDFPATLGIDFGFTYMVEGMFDTTEVDATKADNADKVKYAFGTQLGQKEDNKVSSPTMMLNVGVKAGIDIGYYIFGA